MKVKTGDTVRVITGKDKGREGKILRVYPGKNKVLVENINMFKKHVKKTEQTPQGGVVEVPRPIDASNVVKAEEKAKKNKKVTK